MKLLVGIGFIVGVKLLRKYMKLKSARNKLVWLHLYLPQITSYVRGDIERKLNVSISWRTPTPTEDRREIIIDALGDDMFWFRGKNRR